jgi:CheY-like chemotaxis protein
MTKKIMIIDDEEDMRTYLQVLFKKAGYETELATNGQEALRMMAEVKPDLITLDILMPKQSGLSFFQSLRDEIGNRQIPVIVLSGLAGHREFFEEEAGHQTAFVEKPIDPDLFLAKVQEMIGS